MIVAVALVVFAYVVPSLVHGRQRLADARMEDRFSASLRIVTTGEETEPGLGDHAATHQEARCYLHRPLDRTEGRAVTHSSVGNGEAAGEARQLAAARAARAADISRRAAAASRRLAITTVLLLAAIGGWVLVGTVTLPWLIATVPTVLLGCVLVAGRRAAVANARHDAVARAELNKLAEQVRRASVRRTARGPSGERHAESRAVARSARAEPSGGGAASSSETGSPAAEGSQDASRGAGRDGSAGSASSSGAPAANGVVVRAEPVIDHGTLFHGSAVAVAGVSVAADAPENAEAWTPVSVPMPAYQMKASAPRRKVAPEATAAMVSQAQQASVPSPAEVTASPAEAEADDSLLDSPYGSLGAGDPAAGEGAEAASVVVDADEASSDGLVGLSVDAVLARRRAG